MKYIEADRLRAEIDKRYAEYRAKMKTDDFTYYEGMADALDLFEQYIDTFPEQPEVDLEKELEEEIERFYRTDEYRIADTLGRGFETLARYFAEWGRRKMLEWAKEKYNEYDRRLVEFPDDGAYWGQRNAFQQMIDKLNSI